MKHIPQRTCIACREVRPKRDLIRLVYSSAAGTAEVDRSGKKPGRGAYLCSAPGCWGKRLSKNRLEHVLRGRISSDNWADIVRFGAGLTPNAEENDPLKSET